MPTTVESIEASIDEAMATGFRGRLIARGQSRAIIWRDGVLPPDPPNYSPQLSYDLHSYGYSLLGCGIRLREMGGDPSRARSAFEQAATALEAVIAKGARGEGDLLRLAAHCLKDSGMTVSLIDGRVGGQKIKVATSLRVE